MSHLNNQRKLGFFPTPPGVVDMVASWIGFNKMVGHVKILDPCCGTGEALKKLHLRLAERYPHLTIETYGIEKDPQRSDEAEKNGITHLLKATDALEQVQVVRRQKARYTGEEKEARFDIVWLNPPYDSDKENTRLENTFLRKYTADSEFPALNPGGLLIYIVQRHRLHLFKDWLSRGYENVKVRRFPDDTYKDFRQVVVLATRRTTGLAQDQTIVEELERFATCTDEGDGDAVFQNELKPLKLSSGRIEIQRIVTPGPQRDVIFRSKTFNALDAFMAVHKSGLLRSEWASDLLAPETVATMLPPLRELNPAHTARLLAGGLMDNFVLKGLCANADDHSECLHPMLIRGSTQAIEKVIKAETHEKSDKTEVTTVTERTQHIIVISATDLITGERHVLSTMPNENTSSRWDNPDDFILAYREQLREMSAQAYPPKWDFPNKDRDWPELDMSVLLRQPMGVQQQTIETVVAEMEQRRSVMLAGELTTGKSFISAAAMHYLKQKKPGSRFLILSPPIMTEKWKAEIEKTVPDAKVAYFKSSKDTQEPHFKEANFYVISQMDAKLGNMRRPGVWPTKRFARGAIDPKTNTRPIETMTMLRCPKCGAPYMRGDKYAVAKDVMGDNCYRVCQNKLTRLERHANGTIIRRVEVQHEDEETGRTYTTWDTWKYRLVELKNKRGEPLLCGEQLWMEIAGTNMGNVPPGYHEKTPKGKKKTIQLSLEETLVMTRINQPSLRLGLQAHQYTLPDPRDPKKPFTFHSIRAPKIPLYRYIKHHMQRYFAGIIIDEAHEYKAEDSAQGQAMATLVSCVDGPALALTGTMNDGYASGLYFLLHRLQPEFRKHWKYDNVRGWIERYGVLETKFTVEHRGDVSIGAMSRRKKGGDGYMKPKECPGLAPPALKNILHWYLRITKAEVAVDLPPYREHIVPIKMNAAQTEGYNRVSGFVKSVFKDRTAWGAKLRSSALQLGITWATIPDREWNIYYRDKEHKIERLAWTMPALPADTYPKEQWLIDKCLAEKNRIVDGIALPRKVMVYCSHTNTYDVPEKLRQKLEAEGLRVKIMRSGTPATAKRQQWIQDNAPDMDVFIVHPRMVNVGLDLIDFPTIVFYEMEYSIQLVMQAAGRSHRIGQKEPVDVFFLAYAGTLETDALDLIQRKRKAVSITDGEFLSDGLGADVEDSLSDGLAKMLIEGKVSKELAAISLDDMHHEDIFAVADRIATQATLSLPDRSTPAAVLAELVGAGVTLQVRTIDAHSKTEGYEMYAERPSEASVSLSTPLPITEPSIVEKPKRRSLWDL